MERAASRSWKALVVLSFVGFQVLAHFTLRDSLGVVAVSGLTHATANLVLLWYFATTSQVGLVYGSLTTSIVVLLSLEIGATLLLLGAQVIAEYESIDIKSSAGAPVPMQTDAVAPLG